MILLIGLSQFYSNMYDMEEKQKLENMKRYNSKREAVEAAKELITELKALEKKYSLFFNSDEGKDGDLYLLYKTEATDATAWRTIALGWSGGNVDSKIQVTEVVKDEKHYRQTGLSKLTTEEKIALGLYQP